MMFSAVRACNSAACVVNAAVDATGPERLAVCEFIHKLLRTQALHALGRLLAELMELVSAQAAAAAGTWAAPGQGVSAAAAAAAAADGPTTPTPTQSAEDEERELVATSLAVQFSIVLIVMVSTVVSCTMKLVGLSSAAPPKAPAPAWGQLLGELCAALDDSCVLEHAARASLLILHTSHADVEGEVMTSKSLMVFASDVLHLYRCAAASDPAVRSAFPAAAATAQLHRALSGRCVQTAALCLGLATLAAVDGGPSYALPRPLLAKLPLDTQDGAAAAQAAAGQAAPQQALSSGSWLGAMVALLALPAPSPLPGRRGALAVTLRVGWAAVQSARASEGAVVAGGAGGSAAGPGGSQPAGSAAQAATRPLLAPNCTAATAIAALEAARALINQPPKAGSSPRPSGARAAKAEAEWWRLAVAAARHTPRHAGGSDLRRLVDLLAPLRQATALALDQDFLGMPPEPPAELAAALAGGLLPCLELLMRRAAQAPGGPEAAVLHGLLGQLEGPSRTTASFLAVLLAYGDSRHAAAFLATLGKALRRIDPRVVVASAWGPAERTHQCFMHVAFSLFALPPGRFQHAPGQLASAFSFAASHVLPPFARVTCQLVPLAGERRAPVLSTLLRVQMGWLQMLAARCGACGEIPAAATATSTAAASDAATSGFAAGGTGKASGQESAAATAADDGGDDGGGWRRLVVEEMGAVQLLRAALAMALERKGSDGAQTVHAADTPPERRWQATILASFVDTCRAVAPLVRSGKGQLEAAAAADAAGMGGSGTPAGAGVANCGVEGGGAATAEPPAAVEVLPWHSRTLRQVAERLSEYGDSKWAEAAEALAASLEGQVAIEAGTSDLGAEVRPAMAVEYGANSPATWPVVAALLPPKDARRLLRTCANPGCVNLEGDSEADVQLKACAGCGAVGYCCRACQTAHWRAGHKLACRPRG